MFGGVWCGGCGWGSVGGVGGGGMNKWACRRASWTVLGACFVCVAKFFGG